MAVAKMKMVVLCFDPRVINKEMQVKMKDIWKRREVEVPLWN